MQGQPQVFCPFIAFDCTQNIHCLRYEKDEQWLNYVDWKEVYEGTLKLLRTFSVSEASKIEMRIPSCVERALCVCSWVRTKSSPNFDSTEY